MLRNRSKPAGSASDLDQTLTVGLVTSLGDPKKQLAAIRGRSRASGTDEASEISDIAKTAAKRLETVGMHKDGTPTFH